jgi:hypothetical protein
LEEEGGVEHLAAAAIPRDEHDNGNREKNRTLLPVHAMMVTAGGSHLILCLVPRTLPYLSPPYHGVVFVDSHKLLEVDHAVAVGIEVVQ